MDILNIGNEESDLIKHIIVNHSRKTFLTLGKRDTVSDMKIKTFWTPCVDDEEFDNKVNDFIKNKQVVQISSGDTMLPYDDLRHTLTIMYNDGEILDVPVNTKISNKDSSISMLALAKHILAITRDFGIWINNLQLHKIMYFTTQYIIQEKLLDYDTIEKMYDEPFKVWRYGPVVESIFKEYQVYGATSIIESGETSYYLNTPEINQKILELSKDDPFKLVQISHQENFYKDHSNSINKGRSNIAYNLSDIAGE